MKIELSPKALQIVQHPAKYKVLAAGRRWGKTQLIVPMVYQHLTKEYRTRLTGARLPHKIGYYHPVMKTGIEAIWDRALAGFSPIIEKVDNSLHLIRFTNGGTFQVFGTDVSDFDRLRGPYRTMVIRDEAAHQKEEAYSKVIRPMLADMEGDLLDISTPDGFNLFHKHWERGQSDEPKWKEWMSWQYESWQGGYVTKEYQQAMADEMGEEEYLQEYCARFIGKTGRVYYSFSRADNVTEVNAQNDVLHWAWDFNEVPHCHSTLSHVLYDTVFQFDEICTGNTPQILQTFMARYSPGQFPGIKIYGDSFGNKSTTGLTDYGLIISTLQENGYGPIKLCVPAANPQIRNRTNLVNKMLKSAQGTVRYLIDEKCKKTIRDYELCQRSDTGKIDKMTDLTLSHASDAAGYMIAFLFSGEIDRDLQGRSL